MADDNELKDHPLLEKWMDLANKLYCHQVKCTRTQATLLKAFNLVPELKSITVSKAREFVPSQSKRKRRRPLKAIQASDEDEDEDEEEDDKAAKKNKQTH